MCKSLLPESLGENIGRLILGPDVGKLKEPGFKLFSLKMTI